MIRAPSSRSTTTMGSGAWKGGGMVWLTTKVWTVPRRARLTMSSSPPPQPVQRGWMVGGVEMVPQTRHLAPSRPSISTLPRTKAAPAGGRPIWMGSLMGSSWPRARRALT